MRKRIIGLLMAAAMVLMTFTACGGGGGGAAVRGDGLLVGFSIKHLRNPYMMAMYQTMQDLSRERGFDLISLDADTDVVRQQADVEDLIARGVDILIVDMEHPMAAVTISQIVAQSGIPMFLLNTSVDPATQKVTLVQSNNTLIGQMVGEWVGDNVAGEVRIGLLSGNPGNMVGLARRSGFIQGLAETQLMRTNATNYRVLTQQWGGWSVEGGLQATEDMLVAAPNINVIFAENDAKALGAITAVRNAGREGDILIVAVDGQREALVAIQAGNFDATGLNSPFELTRTVVDIALRYHAGERGFPALVHTTPSVIHSGNVAQYFDPAMAFGFRR